LFRIKEKILSSLSTPSTPSRHIAVHLIDAAVFDFIGKWHMGGETDAPQRGFDHWVSFKGQGTYLPSQNGLSVNGRH